MSKKSITRRRFLTLAGATLGSCALCCVGLGFLASREDNLSLVMPIGFPDLTFGVGGQGERILVAYASAAGSTGGVAELIGKTLATAPAPGPPPALVQVRPVQSVTDLDGYDAVILGSAIHGGKWLPKAVEFLQAHQEKLTQVPTAFFLVGLMVHLRSEANQKLVDQFLAAERALVKPVAEGRFVGAMFTRNYPGIEGYGMRFFIAYCGLGLRGGDFREPNAVRAWAESVRSLLMN